MKTEIITTAIAARRQEIALYEVNIANFTHMIGQITEGDELANWKTELERRLADEQREMRKSVMVLQALEAQLASLGE